MAQVDTVGGEFNKTTGVPPSNEKKAFEVGSTVYLGELDRPMVVTGHVDEQDRGIVGQVKVAWFSDRGEMEHEWLFPDALRSRVEEEGPSTSPVHIEEHMQALQAVETLRADLVEREGRLRALHARDQAGLKAMNTALGSQFTSFEEAFTKYTLLLMNERDEANQQLSKLRARLKAAGLE